jgi:peptidoglycan/xylan/chitin deacetylase (PgdA/CDA1 family)
MSDTAIDHPTSGPAARLSAVTARTIMKQVLAQGDRFLEPAPGVTVLIYHRVGGNSGSEVDLDVDTFRSQLEHLRNHHTVLSLDAAVDVLTPSNTPTGSAVTFDDGTDDFCDHVVPALVEYQLPGTLYAATHFIDTGEPFPWGAPSASWAGLADAASTGLVTIGSHTHTHVLLDRVDGAGSGSGSGGAAEPAAASMVAVELDRSIELIGEYIGTAPATSRTPRRSPALPPRRPRYADVSPPPPSPAAASTDPDTPTSTGSGAHRSNAATATTSSSPRPPAACALKANSATSSPRSSTAARHGEPLHRRHARPARHQGPRPRARAIIGPPTPKLRSDDMQRSPCRR